MYRIACCAPTRGAQLREQHLAHGHEVALTLHHAAELREVGLEPVLFGVALGGAAQVADHGVDVVLQLGHFATRVDLNGAGEVALGHGGRHLGDGAHLVREIGGQQVDVRRQVFPGTGGARHVRLTAQSAFDAHFAGHARHLIGEGRKRGGHAVDGFGERRHFTLGFHGETLTQIAVRHRRHHLHDAAHLAGEVVRHGVDVVGEIFPGAGDAGHGGLTAELAFGADFTRHARHFGGEASSTGRPSC